MRLFFLNSFILLEFLWLLVKKKYLNNVMHNIFFSQNFGIIFNNIN